MSIILTIPLYLFCDMFCMLQSARSGLGLIGSALVGRISDRFGRKPALWIGICASLVSAVINYNTSSVEGMWMALIPSALLNQNYTVFKALFADYTKEMGGLKNDSNESDRASTMGKLGMAVGISFMLGPALGVQFLSSYHDACLLAICTTLLAAGCLAMLPTPKLKRIDSEASLDTLSTSPKDSSWRAVYKFLYVLYYVYTVYSVNSCYSLIHKHVGYAHCVDSVLPCLLLPFNITSYIHAYLHFYLTNFSLISIIYPY